MSDHATSKSTRASAAPKPTGFGTFGGVFTPCVLTILGVIMFLRLGQVAGNAGLWHALAIVLMAKAITGLTSMSLSSIATNTKVQGGGAYFLISRSLGIGYGTSIGVVFFLAQAVSVAMYVIGFVEALQDVLPSLTLSTRLVGTLINVAVFGCVWVGAGWTIKVQYGILVVLIVSLVSFGIGATGSASVAQLEANLAPAYLPGTSFLAMFALFFPAATGIMAGANLSGDLRDPGRSIPAGTLAAVLVTGLVYLAMVVVLCAGASREVLQHDTLVVKRISWVPWLVTAGVFSATLSSALGSMMGAPRVLQALAQDGVFARLMPFARGHGAAREPRRATIATFVIAEGGILLGELDLIAPMITMFFMITYGYLNLATFVELRARNPSFRPRFRYCHWSTALAGALGCGAVMVLMSPLWAAVSVLAMAMLHRLVARQEVRATWGDVHSGVVYERVRRALLRLEEEEYHPKNWRPTILALSGTGWTRPHVAFLGRWLTAGRGVLTLAQVIPGELELHMERRSSHEGHLQRFIAEYELEAFAAVVVSPNLASGTAALVQCHGVGAFRPNLVLTGWSSDPERIVDFWAIMRTTVSFGQSLVVASTSFDEETLLAVPHGTVDVWWRGKDNGHLMLLLAHLLVQNPEWRGRGLRLLRVVASEAGREETKKHLGQLLADARIEAQIEVVVDGDPRGAIQRTSSGAAVVILGMEPPAEGGEQAFVDGFGPLLEALPLVLLVKSAGDMHLDA